MELKKKLTYCLTDQEKFAFELVEDLLDELMRQWDEEDEFEIANHNLKEISDCIDLLYDIREGSE